MPLFTRRHALALAAASVCSLALPARAARWTGCFTLTWPANRKG